MSLSFHSMLSVLYISAKQPCCCCCCCGCIGIVKRMSKVWDHFSSHQMKNTVLACANFLILSISKILVELVATHFLLYHSFKNVIWRCLYNIYRIFRYTFRMNRIWCVYDFLLYFFAVFFFFVRICWDAYFYITAFLFFFSCRCCHATYSSFFFLFNVKILEYLPNTYPSMALFRSVLEFLANKNHRNDAIRVTTVHKMVWKIMHCCLICKWNIRTMLITICQFNHEHHENIDI